MSNKEFVWLDFKRKIVYLAGMKNGDCWSVPATEKERKAFITHFLEKGKKQCTFQELKQYVSFHGVRKKGRVYATIEITDKFLYMDLVRKDENLQHAMMYWILDAKEKNNSFELEQIIKISVIHAIDVALKEVKKRIEDS